LCRLQYKVYRDGCWQRIQFDKGETPPGEVEEHESLQQNPWIQHFKAGVRQDQTVQGKSSFGSQNVGYGGTMLLTCGLGNTTEHSPVYQGHQNSILTEGNFHICIVQTYCRFKVIEVVLNNFAPKAKK